MTDSPTQLATTLRAQRSPNAPASHALPGHLARLAGNTLAQAALADLRTTDVLVKDATDGDRGAELPLYVRVAGEIDQAAGACASAASVLGRDDLHQEGVARLLEDVRAGVIGTTYGGQVGPYIGRTLSRHMRHLADSIRAGAVTANDREKRRVRSALRATITEDGEYNPIAAYGYLRAKHADDPRQRMEFSTFMSILSALTSVTVQWSSPVNGDSTLTYADVVADPHDAFEEVERHELAHQIWDAAPLTRVERDVMALRTGLAGERLRENEIADRLGMTDRGVRAVRARAEKKLGATAEKLDITD
ncbi:hypothetical protein EV193_104393 [Herbihabitans rhizosphaerae]|uniref:Uncharacterized protein n=1 Tax=Herbihabitans rhizosphaerae TaxID=1872711 RepID=A0A4Q7KRR8_9PSEU|nr:sigma-70 family RNA polymerase sigma factor [Herbihabitans rhizosphaerae]RZS39177.1 hypothetical protein EV193_104393 [Herbihabitans rhizosphaerae]